MPRRKPPARRAKKTTASVRAAARRAVERVLSSEETFALMIRRLEQAGWHIERPSAADAGSGLLTPPARER